MNEEQEGIHNLPVANENEGHEQEHGSAGDLLELYEIIEWQKAMEAANAKNQ